ncbi:MAG: IS1634 family transposase, partial [Pirellulaceae bacterium]|nr:IS1634 family transposase [Pirellulaceae bacterium]
HKDDRIRAHVFVCMLAYYVEWHMRQRLREVLFDDCERESASTSRSSSVAPAVRSERAKQKDATRLSKSGHPVQSFQDMLRDLATLTRNTIRVADFDAEYAKLATPTPYQQHVIRLLGATL